MSIYTEREKGLEGGITTDEEASSECVSQQELAAVKAEVDQLHSQLHYWQNVTVNILSTYSEPILLVRNAPN